MRRATFLLSVLLLFLSCGAVFLPARQASAACAALPSDKGQSAGTITIDRQGQYVLWVRMWAPNAASDSVYAQIDNQCPAVINDAKSGNGFIWVNFGNGQSTQSLTYDLTTGSHTVTLAGREAGAGVDRVILTSDPNCVPSGTGDNCLQSVSATTTPQSAVQQAQNPVQKTATARTHKPNWWIVLFCALVVIAGGVYILLRYRKFMRSSVHAMQEPGVIIVGSSLYEQATLRQRLIHFVQHHKLIMAIWLAITLAAIMVGIAAAAGSQQAFEPEAGKLSGGATVAANADASGGKYVIFQNNPTSQAGGAKSGGASGGSSSGGTSTGGGSTGGGTSGGGGTTGGGSTGASTCPLPKYPNTSCTGVPVGTSFKRTVNTDYYANTPGEVIDSWHITGDVVIQATNVTIKNSQIDGHVDNDSLPKVTSFTITDSTIGPATCDTQGWPSLNAHDFTATRVFLRGHQDGVDMTGDNVTVTDSLMQPCYQPPEVVGGDGFHSDGVQDQCSATCSNITLTHNTIDARALYKGQPTGNSALNLGSVPDGSHLRTVTLRDNQFLGGGYTTGLVWDAGATWIIANNVWVQGSWAYGPTDSSSTCANQSWSGNAIVSVDASFAVTSTVSAQGCVN